MDNDKLTQQMYMYTKEPFPIEEKTRRIRIRTNQKVNIYHLYRVSVKPKRSVHSFTKFVGNDVTFKHMRGSYNLSLPRASVS